MDQKYVVAKFDKNQHYIIFSPWDLDQTWGQAYTNKDLLLTETLLPPDEYYFPIYSAFSRAIDLQLLDFAQRFKDRYLELRKGILSDIVLLDRLSLFENDVFASGAILRDSSRWPLSATSQDIKELSNFVVQRMAYMDGYVQDLDNGGE